jgi:tetratricopeptide (TPR) repeat protein
MGNLSQVIGICQQAERLLASVGMQDSSKYLAILDTLADVYLQKGDYVDARRLHEEIIKKTSLTSSPQFYANSLCCLAELDIRTEQEVTDIACHVKAAEAVYATRDFKSPFCSSVAAELLLYRGDLNNARAAFLQCVTNSRGSLPSLQSCLAALGDPKHRMHNTTDTFRWAVISFAFVQRLKSPVGSVQALRSLADLYAIMDDEDTALILFHAALEAGTHMDIHRLRAECMVGIGDIMKRRGNSIHAKEMWEVPTHFLFVPRG